MNCQLDTPAALPRSKQPLVRMLGGPLVDVVAVEQERSPVQRVKAVILIPVMEYGVS